MLTEFSIKTEHEGFYNITSQVSQAVTKSGITDGICVVFCPHTTAGITINENADPDVTSDMLFGLSVVFPDREEYRHFEGNTTAHLKSSFVGVDQTIIIKNGKLHLGVWQGIYFCEFDGPRNRTYFVKIV